MNRGLLDNWGKMKKGKKHARGFFYRINTGGTILEINVLNKHSTRSGEQFYEKGTVSQYWLTLRSSTFYLTPIPDPDKFIIIFLGCYRVGSETIIVDKNNKTV